MPGFFLSNKKNIPLVLLLGKMKTLNLAQFPYLRKRIRFFVSRLKGIYLQVSFDSLLHLPPKSLLKEVTFTTSWNPGLKRLGLLSRTCLR